MGCTLVWWWYELIWWDWWCESWTCSSVKELEGLRSETGGNHLFSPLTLLSGLVRVQCASGSGADASSSVSCSDERSKTENFSWLFRCYGVCSLATPESSATSWTSTSGSRFQNKCVGYLNLLKLRLEMFSVTWTTLHQTRCLYNL